MSKNKPSGRSKRLSRVVPIGLALGFLGAPLGLSPPGLRLEENPALGWLFQLRGPLPPPEEVALVTMDRASQHTLGLSGQYREWPRQLHAQLVERLLAAEPRVLAFDIFFAGSRDGDVKLAQALRCAGRVVLAQSIERHDLSFGDQNALVVKQEVLRDPSPPLAAAAAALAPFALPTGSERVSQVWTFRPESGDAPTLPAVAFQLGALDLYPALRKLLTGLDPTRFADLPKSAERLLAAPGLVEIMRELRGALASDPPLHHAAVAAARALDTLSPADRARLVALIDLYGAAYSRYLEFYGPPLTIEPVPFARVLAMDDAEIEHFRGKAVFVGVSAVRGSEQVDTLPTAYPGAGPDIQMSGVEIAATAYANLVRNESISPLGSAALLALLLGWGLLVGTIAGLLPARRAIPVLLLLIAAYSLLVYGFFVRLDLWLPWLVPIGVQALPAVILGLVLGWREEAQAKRRITAGLARYLPMHVAEGLAAGIHRAEASGEVLKGVCIATDGERYTSLAERLAPNALHTLLNAHYAVVFEPIRRSGGLVSDVIGDACLGLWIATGPGAMERERACLAAIDILAAVQAFNTAHPDGGIPIRIGLHFGEVYLGEVGAGDHFEYRAVGDVVNTATRIEQVNKRLGTRLLVSGEVRDGLEGLRTRDLGWFRLAGKQTPIRLFELIGRGNDDDTDTDVFARDFEGALAAMQRGDWTRASEDFTVLARRRPHDGPARFFAELCRGAGERPPLEDGRRIVCFDTK